MQYQCENKKTYCWAQLGMTVWVDKYCRDDFNGFLRINDYVDWMDSVVERETPSLRREITDGWWWDSDAFHFKWDAPDSSVGVLEHVFCVLCVLR